MSSFQGLIARLRALLRPGIAARELDEEIRFHLDQETARHLQAGLPPDEARRRALAAFGGVQQAREAHREVRGLPRLEEIAADVRTALRTLRRNPALGATAVLTLALGVGANTAVFSAVRAVILRPLPLPAPGRLLMLWEENPEKGWHQQVAAPANYLDWKAQVPAFQDVAAYNNGVGRVTLTGDGPPQLLRRLNVTGGFFGVLGVPAALGRTLRDGETWAPGPPLAVLSQRIFRERFGGDPGVIGRSIRLDGEAVEVVGVMPAGFAFPSEDVDLWMPFRWDPASRGQDWFRRAHWLRVVARLRPAATAAEASAQLGEVAQRLQHAYPQTNRTMTAGLTPLHEFLVGDTRLPLLVLMGAVALLLLIACANVGNLLVVLAASREREIALRLALGAGRGRLARQAFTESGVLALLGGGAGLALGWAGTRLLGRLQPEGMLRVHAFGIDRGVLVYVLGITAASAIVFGLAPAVWSARRAPAAALKEGGPTGSAGHRLRRWREAVVVAEVALALLLTVGAGLLVRSFWALRQVPPGFEARGVLDAGITLPPARYDTSTAIVAFTDELLARARALPGVSGAAVAVALPLTGVAWTSDYIAADRAPDEYGTEVAHQSVSPDYFRTMRVRLLRGRAFTEADRADAPKVLVINDALARRYFAGRDPVGRRIAFDKVPDSTTTWWTIIGVVAAEHMSSLAAEPEIQVYHPFAQQPNSAMQLLVRTAGEPAALAPAVRRLVGAVDPDLALVALQPMTAVQAASLARQRFLMAMLLVFGAVGLALAVAGVYGVLAHTARLRTREMGIRLALGASASEVRWLVVRDGLRLTLAGLAVGSAVALLATRALQGLLYHTPPTDPLTFLVIGALLTATGGLASWFPARGASRTDPASTLRVS